MDDVTFTTLPSLASGAFAPSHIRFQALLDTGSSLSLIHQRALKQMVASAAAAESYVRSTAPRSLSGLGSQELLGTHRRARMAIQSYHNGTFSASLAVWIYIAPNEIVCKVASCLVVMGECVSTCAPAKRLRPHPMAAFSVNSPSRTVLTTLETALPRISATVRPRTLLINLYTTAQASPLT